MRRFYRAMLGVTLLEILLVLSVAAMVIVMSIKYYQNATTSEQANIAMEEIQAITAASDNLAIGSGSYATGGGSSGANVISVVGSANMTSPTNLGASLTWGSATATSYVVTFPLTAAVCASVQAKLAASSHYQSTSATCTSGTLVYTYDNTK